MEARNLPPRVRRQQLLDAALSYAARGWRVFPLQPNSKLPFKGTHGVSDATTDAEQIRAWWNRWPLANIGIAGGNGLIILDEDTYKGADAGQFLLPLTLTAQSARGGLHRYFAYDGDLGNAVEGKLAQGISFRGKGYYAVAPPSSFQGKPYTWLDEEQPLAQLPERIANLIRGEGEEQPTKAAPQQTNRQPRIERNNSGEYWVEKAVEKARANGRNNAGIWLAQQLIWNDCDDPEGAMRYYARLVEDWDTPYYTEREALASLAQARKHQKREPARSQTARPLPPKQERPHLHAVPTVAERGAEYGENYSDDEPPTEPAQAERFPLTEMGNAERLFAAYGQDIRYCKAFGWCSWDGTRWRADGELRVRKWAKKTIRAMYAEAADLAQRASSTNDSTESKALASESVELMKWARKSETDRMVGAMLSLIRDMCEVDPNVFDTHPMLLNVRNGTIDLTTGELREHRRDDYLMQRAPKEYDPNAAAPTFERFVRQIMCDRENLVNYLQRALGYTITGEVKDQVWHLLVGEGENGKGTLIETLSAILGDYAGMLEPESITVGGQTRDPNAPSPEMADLKGKRLVKVTETEEGARIAAARIKRLSGADELKGRHLRRDIFRFMPTFKLWLYTNHRPQARETTHAFWRRVRYIPFDFNLREHPELKDENLPKKLQAEAPGILAWLVRGCLAWQREGLNPPPEVLEATEAYKRDSDLLQMFLDENIETATQGSTTARAVYGRYTIWCEENGERPMSQRRLGEALSERGFQRTHMRTGWVWLNLSLTERE